MAAAETAKESAAGKIAAKKLAADKRVAESVYRCREDTPVDMQMSSEFFEESISEDQARNAQVDAYNEACATKLAELHYDDFVQLEEGIKNEKARRERVQSTDIVPQAAPRANKGRVVDQGEGSTHQTHGGNSTRPGEDTPVDMQMSSEYFEETISEDRARNARVDAYNEACATKLAELH